MGKKILIGIIVLVVIVGLVGFLGGGTPARKTTAPSTLNDGTNLRAVPVTGNIDDAVSEILNESATDVPSAAESDPTLLDENTAAASDFGQSLDGSQF